MQLQALVSYTICKVFVNMISDGYFNFSVIHFVQLHVLLQVELKVFKIFLFKFYLSLQLYLLSFWQVPFVSVNMTKARQALYKFGYYY